jgi:hypothetical protein
MADRSDHLAASQNNRHERQDSPRLREVSWPIDATAADIVPADRCSYVDCDIPNSTSSIPLAALKARRTRSARRRRMKLPELGSGLVVVRIHSPRPNSFNHAQAVSAPNGFVTGSGSTCLFGPPTGKVAQCCGPILFIPIACYGESRKSRPRCSQRRVSCYLESPQLHCWFRYSWRKTWRTNPLGHSVCIIVPRALRWRARTLSRTASFAGLPESARRICWLPESARRIVSWITVHSATRCMPVRPEHTLLRPHTRIRRVQWARIL